MNNLLLWVAGGLVAVLCALFAIPPLVDWNQYRGVFEEEVSRLLGREVRVGGKVRLRILPVPYVGFEKVRIADAPGISGSFLRAERFAMLLSVPPLLRGVVEARELQIDGPTIRLRFDDDGGTNWQKLSIRHQDLAFVPSDIALQSARIKNGAIILETVRGVEIARIDQIGGELSADALIGPYRFTGRANFAGKLHDLRLATAAAGDAGEVQLQATATAAGNSARHTVKGFLRDLQTVPKLEAALETRAKIDPEATGDKESSEFTLTADIAVDPTVARLSNIAVSFDSAGRPQQITGSAQAAWQSGLTVTGALSSKWLDIDAITSGKSQKNPIAALQLIKGGALSLGSTGRRTFALNVEQANLGGDVISSLGIRVMQQADVVQVETLRASLPGRTRLHAQGLIRREDADEWRGNVLLQGASLQRFAAWARPDLPSFKGRATGSFALDGTIVRAKQSISVSNATVDFAGGTSTGGLTYAWGDTPKLAADLDADRLDISGIGSGALHPTGLARLLGLGQQDDRPASPFAGVLTTGELDLRLRAGEIADTDRSISNVAVRLSRKAGGVEIKRARLTIEPGLEIETSGKIDTSTQKTAWSMSGVLSANSEETVERLNEFSTLLLNTKIGQFSGRRAFPMRIAFKTSGKETANSGFESQLTADGEIRAGRLRLSATSRGPADQWRENPLRLRVMIDSDRARSLLALFQDRDSEAIGTREDKPALLRFDAEGVPKSAMRASAVISSQQWSLNMHGMGQVGANGEGSAGSGHELAWSGQGRLQTGSIRAALSDLGHSWSSSVPSGIPVAGVFEFATRRDATKLEPVDVRVGASTLSGQLEWRSPRDSSSDRSNWSGHVSIDRLDGPSLAALFLQDSTARQVSSADNAVGAQPAWSDKAFALGIAQSADVDIRVKAGVLNLADNLNLRRANVRLGTTNGALQLTELSGRLNGGKLTGQLQLEPAAAGARLVTSVKLKGAPLQRFVDAGLTSRVAGTFDLAVEASGQALSPLALMSTLQGDGQVELRKARAPGLGGTALSAIAGGIVGGEVEPGELASRLDKAALEGAIAMGSRKVGVKVADGIARLNTIELSQDGIRLVNDTTLDLARLLFDSQWRVETKIDSKVMPDGSPIPQMPEIQVVYAGALSTLSATEPRIDVGDLQRELTVQRMEVNVRRLEKLRLEDEARAKAEEERLRQLELDRQRALEEEAAKRSQQPATPRVPADGNLTESTLPEPILPNGGQSAATGQTPPPTATSAQPLAPPAAARPVRRQPPPPRRKDPFSRDN